MRQTCDGKSLVKFPLAHATLHVPLVNLKKCTKLLVYNKRYKKVAVTYRIQKVVKKF